MSQFKVVLAVVCVGSLIGSSIGLEGANKTVAVSRKHLAVWFDYSVRYYDHEADNAYSKADLEVMVNVVSQRFSKLAIDVAPIVEKLPPESSAHSRIWIPEVVATHNKASSTSSSPPTPPMQVIVSFDVANLAKTSQVTSFDVAKYMADTANLIFPGTVKTLMMYTGFTIFSAYYNVKDTVQQLKIAREKIAGNLSTSPSLSSTSSTTPPIFNYDLAVFMDLKDCGHFKGSIGQKAKEFLPHVDIIVILLRPNYHQMAFTAEILHKMFVTKFQDCEKKLKDEKPSIRVVPSVLWMARKGSVSGMAKCWQMMSQWGEENDKEVIMYEAFDTPHGHLLSDQGWWRLKDRSEHEIKEEAFIEKIQEKGSKRDPSSTAFPSLSDESEEVDLISSPHNLVGSSGSLGSSAGGGESSRNSPQALYIVLVLLSVVCTLLGAVIIGLLYGLRSMVILPRGYNSVNQVSFGKGGDSGQRKRLLNSENHRRFQGAESQASFQGEEEEDEGAAGAVLEIRDTTPIVAVTYKK